MTKVYVRMTKKFVSGSLVGIVLSDVLEVANEQVAQRMVKDCPKGSVVGGGWLGPKAEVLTHDYVVEEKA